MSARLWTVAIIAVLWGVQPILHKVILRSVSPVTLFALSGAAFALAVGAFAAVNASTLRRDRARLTPTVVALILLAAAGGGFVGHVLYLRLLASNDAHHVAALVHVSPAVTAVVAALVLRERVSARSALGVALVVGGAAVLAMDAAERSGDGRP